MKMKQHNKLEMIQKCDNREEVYRQKIRMKIE